MEKILTRLVLVLLILLSSVGVALPIPMFYDSRFQIKKDNTEELEMQEEDLDELTYIF